MSEFLAPVRASLDVTYACDLRCIHCRTNTGEIPVHIRRAMLNIEQLKKLMIELDRMGTFEITLTGGEPTMRKGFWELIDVVPKLRHSTVTLITNAASLDRRQMDRIIGSGIQSIRVSVDGTREMFERVRLIDAFDQVIENSSYLQSKVQSFKLLTVVMKTNRDNIWQLVDSLRVNGFRRQDLILVRAHGRGGRNRLLLTEKETMDLYAAIQTFRRAVMPTEYDLRLNAPYLIPSRTVAPIQDVVAFPYFVRDSSIAISATGDVTMSRLYSPHPLGNLKDRSVAQIWAEGQAQLAGEKEQFSEEQLREIFWEFARDDSAHQPTSTSLLDRQIFEGYEVR